MPTAAQTWRRCDPGAGRRWNEIISGVSGLCVGRCADLSAAEDCGKAGFMMLSVYS